MSAWALSEVPTVNKMNQKTVFVGASAPSNPQDGQFWLDTSTNPYTLKMYHSVAAVWRMVDTATKKVKLPAAVAADYATPPGSATASSENSDPEATPWLDGSTVTQFSLLMYTASGSTRCGQVVSGDNSTTKVRRVTFKLKKVGTPTGTLTLKVWDNSTNWTVRKTGGTLDVSTLTTSYAEYSFDINPEHLLPAESEWVGLELSGGVSDVSNYVEMLGAGSGGSNVIANGGFRWGPTPGGFDYATEDVWIKIFRAASPATYAASKAKDDNTTAYWQPAPINETNAYVYFDITNAASLIITSGCRIYLGASSEIPQTINIDVSQETGAPTTWINVKQLNGASLTPNAWNEVSFNAVRARYIRIQAGAYGSATIKIFEFDYYSSVTDRAIVDHGHGDVV